MARRFRLGHLVATGLLAAVSVAAIPALEAQTLARKGWAGSGMTVEPWWKNAVFYELNPRLFDGSDGEDAGDLKGVAGHLDYLQALGVDSIVLSPFALQAKADSRTEEDFEQLASEASRRKMRLMVDLPVTSSMTSRETLAAARFWLTRGVAGFRVTTRAGDTLLDPTERTARLAALRKLCASFMGERVLMAETLSTGDIALDPVPLSGVPVKSKARAKVAPVEPPVQLRVDQVLSAQKFWNASGIGAALFGSALPGGVVVSDMEEREQSSLRYAGQHTPAEVLAVEKMLATVLFLGQEEPMLYFGQELGLADQPGKFAAMNWQADATSAVTVTHQDSDPNSLLNWYREMSRLRHEQAALHAGALLQVATGYPDVVAWVRKGPGRKDQPIVMVLNVSPEERLISVADELHRLGLSTAYGVRAVALSVKGTNPTFGAAGISLSAYGAYVGEVRQPGLEDAPAPALPSHHRHR